MSDLSEKKDQELVVEALRDGENFALLMDRYEGKLIRYVRRFTGMSRECAEDVVQEVFLKTYRNLNDFDQDLSFSSWVYRIAHNEAVNFLKKHKAKQTVSLETDDDAVDLIKVLSSDVDVEKEVKQSELVEIVRGVLKGMKSEYREVLVLKFLEDKDYEEISDILKRPMGTVATLINRAKKQFKKLAEKNLLKF